MLKLIQHKKIIEQKRTPSIISCYQQLIIARPISRLSASTLHDEKSSAKFFFLLNYTFILLNETSFGNINGHI